MNSSYPTENQIKNSNNTYAFKMHQQRLNTIRIQYLPQTFSSADQTENYDIQITR